jgi:hypothetical protein
MAKHEIVIHENTGATKESAPFLGGYVTKNTIDLVALCKTAAELTGQPELKLQNLIENDIDAFIALERQGACRIHVDGGYVELRILGSFEAGDSAWDPMRNTLVVAFTPDDEVKTHLVNEIPKIVTDETSTKVRVDNVFDVEIPKPTELIHGRHEFTVQGINLSMSDVGAKVELVNGMGVRFTCTVVRQVNRQNVICKSDALLEPGNYKCYVFSRGGDPEGQLQGDYRNVKYLKVIDVPTITKIATPGKDGIVKGEAFDIEGTNLRYNTGDTVKVKWTTGTPGEQLLAPTTVTATKMSFAAVSGFDALPDNTELTFEVTIDETCVSASTIVGA